MLEDDIHISTDVIDQAEEIGWVWARARRANGWTAPAASRYRVIVAAIDLLASPADATKRADATRLADCAFDLGGNKTSCDLAAFWKVWLSLGHAG